MDTTFEELKNVKSDCCIKIIFQTLRTPAIQFSFKEMNLKSSVGWHS